MTNRSSPYVLPERPEISETVRRAVRSDYDRFAEHGLPPALEDYLQSAYGLDVSAQYAGYDLKNPWGKASGQLSMTAHQVAEDIDAGLGFVVLKTVIAQDESGIQTMRDWAIREARMVAEPIVGASGRSGWTISWKGRGWWQSFDEYLDLIREARRLARDSGTLIVPSCKFHLPTPSEDSWNIAEYRYTTQRLLEAWDATPDNPMPLEKDFSPTLAGSDRANQQSKILEWLRTVPRLVREACLQSSAADASGLAALDRASSRRVIVGLKMFNAMFADAFQVEMLQSIHQPGDGRPDFYVYANRLFDPNREFDGHRGIAYGGPDLSDRNLRTMDAFLEANDTSAPRAHDELYESAPPLSLPQGFNGFCATSAASDQVVQKPLNPRRRAGGGVTSQGASFLLPWSATGNITTGKTALEYALRGAGSFQLHTFFQLPADQYRMKIGGKTQKALHELYFHPETGFIVWMHHWARVLGLPTAEIRFGDVVGRLDRGVP